MFRDGAAPVIDEEDRRIRRPSHGAVAGRAAMTVESWGVWTSGGERGDGPQGPGVVHAAAQGADRAERTGRIWRRFYRCCRRSERAGDLKLAKLESLPPPQTEAIR